MMQCFRCQTHYHQSVAQHANSCEHGPFTAREERGSNEKKTHYNGCIKKKNKKWSETDREHVAFSETDDEYQRTQETTTTTKEDTTITTTQLHFDPISRYEVICYLQYHYVGFIHLFKKNVLFLMQI